MFHWPKVYIFRETKMRKFTELPNKYITDIGSVFLEAFGFYSQTNPLCISFYEQK